MPLNPVREYTISRLSVLDEQGNVDPEFDPRLDDAQLHRLYRGMVHGREADQRMLRLQRQGRMGTFSPSSGQEAASCGPVLAMTERDWLVPAFRELGGLLMRGVPFSRVLMFWGGYEEGNVFPGVERTLPIAVIVGSQIPHAAGAAYALQYGGEKNAAAVCFFGDGATSQGDFLEGVNMAAVWQAPAVFICQNNQWAISTPLRLQTRCETIAQKAIAFGIPGVQVDGNDALAMYRATREALDRAYAGEGPTLIEALTYRVMMHTTADDPSKYRREDDVREWEARDPLIRFRRYLEAKGLWNEEQETALREQIKNEIDAAVREYESFEGFRPEAPFDHVYGTRHAEIEVEREQFMRELRGEKVDA
ncbi:MAG: pyruvate dehydrogenase (acetyl-transferring) E1 component subunit alpha [Acidobacteria bacterium]|nr:pyruvate dehydrogenase (acetyl-transferring) E1 component subunit alpha [Acidobacteriota bacterium]